MEIVVLGRKVETTEIFDIKNIEHNNGCLDCEAGFIIYLIDKEPLFFRQQIPYGSLHFKISEIKSKWKKLQNEIYEKWQKDVTDLPVFRLE